MQLSPSPVVPALFAEPKQTSPSTHSSDLSTEEEGHWKWFNRQRDQWATDGPSSDTHANSEADYNMADEDDDMADEADDMDDEDDDMDEIDDDMDDEDEDLAGGDHHDMVYSDDGWDADE